MLVWDSKDPDEIARREIDWEKHPGWQRYDAISSATFSLSTAAGMSIASSNTDNAHSSWVFLSGGTADSVGKVLCEVVTGNGQTLQQTATIMIEDN
jgi:hypothetical protein